MSKRTLFFFSILLVFVLAITGCDKKDKAADTGKAKDTLNIGFFAEPSTLDCIEGNDEASRIVAYQIYEYLIREQPDNLGPRLGREMDFFS